MEEPAPGTPQEPGDDATRRRLDAYAYLSAPERLEHIAIMRVFCGTLLADLAVPDVMAKLRESGGPGAGLDADTLTARLEQLERWGNLLRGSHTVKASSITEYQRSRARYQLSRLGERIQRDADAVLAEADAAREVSNELLALVERGLRELAELVSEPGRIAPQDGLERVSTLFVQFAEFADSIRARRRTPQGGHAPVIDPRPEGGPRRRHRPGRHLRRRRRGDRRTLRLPGRRRHWTSFTRALPVARRSVISPGGFSPLGPEPGPAPGPHRDRPQPSASPKIP